MGSDEGRWWHGDTLTEKYLRDAYTRREMTCREIGAEVGVDHRTVHRYLLRFGIPLRTAGTRARRRDEYLRPAERLTKQYLAETVGRRKLTVAQVAEETGFGETTVRHYMHVHGVEPAMPGRYQLAHHLDRDELARLLGDGMSFVKIGERLGCSQQTVARRVYRWGLSAPGRLDEA